MVRCVSVFLAVVCFQAFLVEDQAIEANVPNHAERNTMINIHSQQKSYV